MTVLDFTDALLLMEGLDRLTDQLRDQVAAGHTSAQHDLKRADNLAQRLAQAASIELTTPTAPASAA